MAISSNAFVRLEMALFLMKPIHTYLIEATLATIALAIITVVMYRIYLDPILIAAMLTGFIIIGIGYYSIKKVSGIDLLD